MKNNKHSQDSDFSPSTKRNTAVTSKKRTRAQFRASHIPSSLTLSKSIKNISIKEEDREEDSPINKTKKIKPDSKK